LSNSVNSYFLNLILADRVLLGPLCVSFVVDSSFRDSPDSLSTKLFGLTPWIWYPALRCTTHLLLFHFMDSNTLSGLMCR